MSTSELGHEIHLDEPYDAAIERVSAALKEQGFGILTRIDVKEALKEKLDVDFRPYVILGACNPRLAHQALSARADVGLMLPCNVTVETDPGGGSTVRIVDPKSMLETGDLQGDPAVSAVAAEAEKLLENVAKSLESAAVGG